MFYGLLNGNICAQNPMAEVCKVVAVLYTKECQSCTNSIAHALGKICML